MDTGKREAPSKGASDMKAKPRLFRGADGRIRLGWLLAAGLIGYLAVNLLGRWGLGRGFAALFEAWGIDASNAQRVPGWARFLYAWHGSLVALAVSAATLCLAGFMNRSLGRKKERTGASPKALFRYALAGLGAAALIAALCLIPDSARLQWPLSAPRLGWALVPLSALSLLATLAEEAFTKQVLYDGLGGIGGLALSVAAFFAVNGGWTGNWVSAVNVLLLGAVCTLLYSRRGLWAATGLRWGWSVGNVFLLGFGGGAQAVYRLYGVSEPLLTGGDAGIMYGLWTTLLLAALAGAMLLRGNQKK